MSGYALGIDLGTTYTAAALARGGRVEIVTLGNRAAAIPTVVFADEDGRCRVGEAAEPLGIAAPWRLAREFKRRLGDPTPLVLGGVAWSADALMAEVLRFVADTTAAREGGPAERVVLTHPANWGPFKLDLLTQAVRLAGLKVDRYLSEPEAAAFAYASNAAERLRDGAVVAVYDLGGGTFDATVLRLGAAGFEILGNPEGIERLGGIDVDEMVLAHVRRSLGDALERLDPDDPAVLPLLARLRHDAVVAKEQLSSETAVAIPVTLPHLQTQVRLTRAELETMVRVPVARTIESLRRAITGAGVTPEDLDAVLLVGGSSRMPVVADMVTEALGRPVAIDAHPKFGVAMGAALAGWGVSPSRPQERADAPVVTRVLPFEPPAQEAPPAAPAPVHAPAPAPVHAAPSTPERPDSPGRPVPAPVTPAGSSPGSSAGSSRTVKVLVAVVAVLALGVAGLGGVLLGRETSPDRLGVVTPQGAVAPVGAVECPSGVAAVCIDRISFQDGQAVVDFSPQGAELAAPTDGRFPEDTVHPLFFIDAVGPEQGRHWGPASPFAGSSESGFSGYAEDDFPPDSNLCVVLADDAGTWVPGTGNCVPAPLA